MNDPAVVAEHLLSTSPDLSKYLIGGRRTNGLIVPERPSILSAVDIAMSGQSPSTSAVLKGKEPWDQADRISPLSVVLIPFRALIQDHRLVGEGSRSGAEREPEM